jgi:tricorn protease
VQPTNAIWLGEHARPWGGKIRVPMTQQCFSLPKTCSLLVVLACLLPLGGVAAANAQGTRLLRQPALSESNVAFAYGGDLWVVDLGGGEARRLTSTPAVESDPHFSPDGKTLAFTSNRVGVATVYVVPVAGGAPQRLTWYPAPSYARGWTPDGERVLYASPREAAPVGFFRLWTVLATGGPSELLPAPWGYDGSYSSDAKRLIVDRVTRWDSEWRHYRGGQNTPLTILDLDDLGEIRLPNERTTDVHPVWMGDAIYFLSDQDRVMNVWSYDPDSGDLTQLTLFEEIDVKWLSGHHGALILERDGNLLILDLATGETRQLEITVRGDFPWAEPRWEDVSKAVRSASLSPTGKRALFEARGEVFTVPVEKGDTRNLTRSSGAADRAPAWSPKGDDVAWFSDTGPGYELLIAAQDGLSEPRRSSIGESKMAWEVTWSPDAGRIAFVDDDVRVRVVEIASGKVVTADVGGVNIERGDMGLTWSPDSKWLAYVKTFPNKLRRVVVWSVDGGLPRPITNTMADAASPAWDADGKHLYFLASTDLALGSGWANTSQMGADPTYGVYAVVLSAEQPTPFEPESDEEEPEEDVAKDSQDKKEGEEGESGAEEPVDVRIDFDGIGRRIVPLPMPVSRYQFTRAGPAGSVFVGERVPPGRGVTLHKFTLEKREAKKFVEAVSNVSVSADGKKMLYRSGEAWSVVGTDAPPEA